MTCQGARCPLPAPGGWLGLFHPAGTHSPSGLCAAPPLSSRPGGDYTLARTLGNRPGKPRAAGCGRAPSCKTGCMHDARCYGNYTRRGRTASCLYPGVQTPSPTPTYFLDQDHHRHLGKGHPEVLSWNQCLCPPTKPTRENFSPMNTINSVPEIFDINFILVKNFRKDGLFLG